MDIQDVTMQMSELLHVNEGSVKAYDEALQKMQDQPDLKGALQQYRNDHQQHVQDVRSWFQQSGQRPSQVSEEFQNLLQTTLEDIRMARGRDEVLKAMTIAEAFDNAVYGEAVRLPAPNDVRQQLQSHLDAEHRHWQFVEQYSPLKVMATTGMMGGSSGSSMGGGMGGTSRGIGGGGMGGY